MPREGRKLSEERKGLRILKKLGGSTKKKLPRGEGRRPIKRTCGWGGGWGLGSTKKIALRGKEEEKRLGAKKNEKNHTRVSG